MALGTSIVDVVLIIAIMFAAGEVTGLTGFGFALVSTTTLAIVLDPETAVVIAILPVPVTNISTSQSSPADCFENLSSVAKSVPSNC